VEQILCVGCSEGLPIVWFANLEFYGYYFTESNKRELTFIAFISCQLFACNILAQQDDIKDCGCWLKSRFRKTNIDAGLGYEVKYRTSFPK